MRGCVWFRGEGKGKEKMMFCIGGGIWGWMREGKMFWGVWGVVGAQWLGLMGSYERKERKDVGVLDWWREAGWLVWMVSVLRMIPDSFLLYQRHT